MITIILLFAVAALFGISLIIPVLGGKMPARGLVFAHGGIAAIALVMLLLRFFNQPGSVPKWSVIFFVVAALGGFILFAIDLRKKTVPKSLALVHASVAVIAFLILLFAAIGG
jgi:hypothetical protein